MALVSAECTITASSQAVSCELAGEIVVLDTRTERYFALSAVGAQIWTYLQDPCTLGSLCDRLMEEYEVEPNQCRADVSALLEQLAQQGLVTVSECVQG